VVLVEVFRRVLVVAAHADACTFIERDQELFELKVPLMFLLAGTSGAQVSASSVSDLLQSSTSVCTYA
jgi:hypothetical protein